MTNRHARGRTAASDAEKWAGQALREALGSGVRVRDRNQASAGLDFLIDQLEYFLSFIGLASLIAGGLGVFGAVSAYLQGRQPSIAMLKALGASGALVRNVYLIQIVLLALLGVLIGLVLGALAPMALGLWVGQSLPVPALFGLYPAPRLQRKDRVRRVRRRCRGICFSRFSISSRSASARRVLTRWGR